MMEIHGGKLTVCDCRWENYIRNLFEKTRVLLQVAINVQRSDSSRLASIVGLTKVQLRLGDV
jgi:hypothetical protein